MPKNVFQFPSVKHADEDGIIAIGGDTSPERLLAAYQRGIFPWPHEDLPLLWFCPDPRFVLRPRKIHLPRSLAKAMQHSTLSIVADRDFKSVINHCAKSVRPGRPGTWINREIATGYQALHALGYAHSIEAYENHRLVGGLYGVSLGRIFFGESMFCLQPNASKITFATLVAFLIKEAFDLVDCQAYTDHLQRFGAREMPRSKFLEELKHSLNYPTKRFAWELRLNPQDAVKIIKENQAKT